jgi:hypothetical protein
VCYCVVPKCVGVVIMYAPFTVGSSPCLCSRDVYRSVYVDGHSGCLRHEMSLLAGTLGS